MNILFLMGNAHNSMNREEYPLYLTEIDEKMILETQVEYTGEIKPRNLLFCVKESEIKRFHVDSIIKQIEPQALIIPIHEQTKGAVCTALLGAQYIDNEQELLLMAIDDFMDADGFKIIDGFHKTGADAGVVLFKSVHPRYSFVKLNAEDAPVEFAEKRPISKNALVSFYYFKRGHDFIECAKDVIRKDNPVNGNFYISQTLNEMLLKQKKIALHQIPNEKFHPLKTELQMAEYIAELHDKRSSK